MIHVLVEFIEEKYPEVVSLNRIKEKEFQTGYRVNFEWQDNKEYFANVNIF